MVIFSMNFSTLLYDLFKILRDFIFKNIRLLLRVTGGTKFLLCKFSLDVYFCLCRIEETIEI